MRMSKLFQAQLIREVILFGILAIVMSFFFSSTMQAQLLEEFTNRGKAISNSIASSSVELILNRDASTIQATIDQFIEADDGVAYVLVADHQHELVAHTFVPAVPDEMLQILQSADHETLIRELNVPNMGNYLDIASPILAGTVGYVHVGMDQSIIDGRIRSVIVTQVGIIALIFLISAIVAYIQANRVSQPLMKLAEFARQVTSDKSYAQTASDAEQELAPIAQRTDEVGQLTQNFQQMVQEVLEREQKLELRSVELAQANQEITELSKRLKIENIRLGAQLGASRQESAQQRITQAHRVTPNETERNLVILDDAAAQRATVERPRPQAPIIEVTKDAPADVERIIQAPAPVEDRVKPPAQVAPITQAPAQVEDRVEQTISAIDITRQLQQLLLPTAQEVRKIQRLELAGVSNNAISGDDYNLLMQHGQVQLGIANTNGGSPSSGVLMFMTTSVVRTLLTSDERDQSLFLMALQRTIKQSQPETQPLSLALLDLRDDDNLTLGGQSTQMIVVDHKGEVTLVDPYDLGLPMGTQSKFNDASRLHFQGIKGAVLFSNGITTVQSGTEAQWLEQAQAVVSRHWQESAEQLANAIMEALRQAEGTDQLANNFSLLVVKQK